MSARLAATRSHLLRSRRRLERVGHGIALLTRKRRALAAELFRVAAPAIEARSQAIRRAQSAYPALVAALAARGGGELEALGWPARRLEVEVGTRETWGIATGTVQRLTPVRRTYVTRGLAPGLTGPAAGVATGEFETMIELLLDSASTELLLRRLAEELRRTSRQVNALERRVAPALAGEVRRLRALLEEREREDHIRLKHLAERRPRSPHLPLKPHDDAEVGLDPQLLLPVQGE